mmetsp:Transcript_36142/g.87378  ORF Transcript_36142/g.87378 Transcript_36142/m.87378 type:complete len:620 (-) Transcript_36142:2728-4587(-)
MIVNNECQGLTIHSLIAVVVTAATAGLVATNLLNTTNNIVPPITTICGLVEPDVRKEQLTMIFEGFARSFDDREQLIVEALVAEAYNNLTIGSDVESAGCLDPLSREMTEAKLVNQTWDLIAEGYNPLLETVFETTLLCDKCMALRPLFSPEKEDERRLFQLRSLEQDGIDGADLVSSALLDFTSREFFQRLLQLVIFKTEDLSEIGELPDGFVQMTKAFVTPILPDNDGVSESGSSATSTEPEPEQLDEYLVTEITYQPQGTEGEKGAFQFTYVNEETGEVETEIVVVNRNTIVEDPFVDPVPTTPFPTFAPTRAATISPSTVPTNTVSGQPTREPSMKPSMAPTNISSVVPSESSSAVPSVAPSNVLSIVPTEPPSMVPSFPPSDAPSFEPTITNSIGPTRTPSKTPSMVPSYIPSDTPSTRPSVSPSMIPSMIPSYVPSSSPSMNPSSIPSMAPSGSPSLSPSDQPSASPSRSPSVSPSVEPSMSPSSSPSTVPSSSPTVTTSYYVVCGGTGACAGGTALLNSNRVTDDTGADIAVRCCSDTAITNWTQYVGCPYATSVFSGNCYRSKNWYDAGVLCGSVGARLCTRTEIENHCTSGTGCAHNNRPCWSSTSGTPP